MIDSGTRKLGFWIFPDQTLYNMKQQQVQEKHIPPLFPLFFQVITIMHEATSVGSNLNFALKNTPIHPLSTHTHTQAAYVVYHGVNIDKHESVFSKMCFVLPI